MRYFIATALLLLVAACGGSPTAPVQMQPTKQHLTPAPLDYPKF